MLMFKKTTNNLSGQSTTYIEAEYKYKADGARHPTYLLINLYSKSKFSDRPPEQLSRHAGFLLTPAPATPPPLHALPHAGV